MHLIAYFLGISSAITVVKSNIETKREDNIIQTENYNQDDDEALYGIKLNHDEHKITEQHPGSMELRKKKCGKTKLACKDLGGYCHDRSKEDECDGTLLTGKKYCPKNKKCGCCVPTELCTRANGGKCNLDLTSYRPKYDINGNPCICKVVNEEIVPGECNVHDGDERCYIQDVESLVRCGDTCHFANMPNFYDHVCPTCNTHELAQEFCKDRFGKTKSLNHVFATVNELAWGKIDYAVNQYGQVQKLCMIPEYVQAWFCARHDVRGWECKNIQFCTGGGTMPTGSQGDKPGHFMMTSLHCSHHRTP